MSEEDVHYVDFDKLSFLCRSDDGEKASRRIRRLEGFGVSEVLARENK